MSAVASLVRKGLAEQLRDDSDRRVRLVRLSELPDAVSLVTGELLAPETLGPAVNGVAGIVHNLIAAVNENSPGARVVMASTSLVYSEELPWPSRETTKVLRFDFVYGDGDPHLSHAPRLFNAWGWHPAHALHLIRHKDIAKATLRKTGFSHDVPTVFYARAAGWL